MLNLLPEVFKRKQTFLRRKFSLNAIFKIATLQFPQRKIDIGWLFLMDNAFHQFTFSQIVEKMNDEKIINKLKN